MHDAQTRGSLLGLLLGLAHRPPGVLGLPSPALAEPDRSTRLDPSVANRSASGGKGGAILGSSCAGGRPSEGPVDGGSGLKGIGPELLIRAPALLDEPPGCLELSCRIAGAPGV